MVVSLCRMIVFLFHNGVFLVFPPPTIYLSSPCFLPYFVSLLVKFYTSYSLLDIISFPSTSGCCGYTNAINVCVNCFIIFYEEVADIN